MQARVRDKARRMLLLAAAFIAVGGCRGDGSESSSSLAPKAAAHPSPQSTAPDADKPPDQATWWDGASDCVFEEWRVHQNGYALEEILERYVVEDRWDGYKVKPGITTGRVLELLGEPSCKGSENREDCYPNYGPGDWLYNGSRFTMPNDYWHFHFDSEGVLQSLDWSGE